MGTTFSPLTKADEEAFELPIISEPLFEERYAHLKEKDRHVLLASRRKLLMEEDLEGVAQDLIDLHNRYPDEPVILNNLSTVLYALEDPNASDVQRKLIEDFPDYPMGKIRWAHCRLDEEDFGSVVELIGPEGTLLELCSGKNTYYPSEVIAFQVLMVRLCIMTGDLDQAEAFLERAEEIAEVFGIENDREIEWANEELMNASMGDEGFIKDLMDYLTSECN